MLDYYLHFTGVEDTKYLPGGYIDLGAWVWTVNQPSGSMYIPSPSSLLPGSNHSTSFTELMIFQWLDDLKLLLLPLSRHSLPFLQGKASSCEWQLASASCTLNLYCERREDGGSRLDFSFHLLFPTSGKSPVPSPSQLYWKVHEKWYETSCLKK